MSRYLPLICLALTHLLVDACALLVAPLWPALQTTFGLGVAGLSMVFILQLMPASLSQMVFGYFGDRRAAPHLLWLGPVAAAVFLTMIGVVSDFFLLCGLLILGGIGVGAFHPEAAVAVGRLMPENRTRALSVFMFGGSLGVGIGPLLSGAVGMQGLVYLGPAILFLILLFRRLGRLDNVSETPAGSEPALSLREMLAGRAYPALFLLIICSLRLVPNTAMDKVLAFTLESQGHDTFRIGLVQTLFLTSACAGMFLMAFRFRSGLEKTFMIWCPLLGIPLMWVLGCESCPEWLLLCLLIPTGMILWGTAPAMVSYAQQLLPRGAGLASAITLGLSWGVGGLIQAPVTAYFQAEGVPRAAFHAFIPCLALAALGACLLPTISGETVSESAGNETQDLSGPQPEPLDA